MFSREIGYPAASGWPSVAAFACDAFRQHLVLRGHQEQPAFVRRRRGRLAPFTGASRAGRRPCLPTGPPAPDDRTGPDETLEDRPDDRRFRPGYHEPAVLHHVGERRLPPVNMAFAREALTPIDRQRLPGWPAGGLEAGAEASIHRAGLQASAVRLGNAGIVRVASIPPPEPRALDRIGWPGRCRSPDPSARPTGALEAGRRGGPRIMSDARSANMIVGAFRLPTYA